MRSAEDVLRRPVGGNRGPVPQSSARWPSAFEPHPPLVSGGWYQCADQEVTGPGRYPVDRPVGRSAGAALFWTTLLGPLGLCYFSFAGGLVAAVLAAAIVVATGSVVLLAVIWPVCMALALLGVPWN
ncbi:hypothetical protein [Amycolatopsis samaneae]|uniref:Uncharacterized protein n=1 Tax=Amycolatopsis samaneae TaxID=664691 RepID=A0ABW5GMD2_9PSEU